MLSLKFLAGQMMVKSMEFATGAGGTGGGIQGLGDIETSVDEILKTMQWGAGLLAIIMFAVIGLMYIIGGQELVQKGKKMIVTVFIGLAFVGFGASIVDYARGLFGF